ncbi:MAG: Neutral ceramidase [Planctomycetota bacterium]|nr:Neutral ceramidase [Planctomycetota bacterium]
MRSALLILALAGSVHAEEFRVGAAVVDITPPIGTPMAGYYFERASEGVHDTLFAKAIVMESAGKKAALVSLDLISTPQSMVEDARQEIEKVTGVKGVDVMISATHAHTGPVLQGRGAREDAFGGKNPLARKYGEDLPKRIAEAVRRAENGLKPAKVAAAHGRESSIAFNRRFHMSDGTVGWNPGKLNPKIVKAAGPIDPDVAVVTFETDDKDRKPLATYVNYAVHLDNVGGTKFSADLPATVADLLGRFKGPEMVTVYTSGCCGDINHIDVKWAERQGGHENAARMGIILSAEVLRTWPKLSPGTAGALRMKTAKVKLPLARITPEDVSTARAVVEKVGKKGPAPPFMEMVQAYKVLDVEARKGEPIEVEVQVIALGDRIAWVSLPGEIFVDLGLEIKQDSPYPHTIIAELANGAIGYIPSRRAYVQGNYEVVSARCAEGSGEMLVEAAVKMLREMHLEAKGDAGK